MSILFGILFVVLVLLGVVLGGVTLVKEPRGAKFVWAWSWQRAGKYWAGAVGCFLLMLAFMSFVQVDAGNVGVVKRWGRPVGQLDPGPHFIMPFSDEVWPVAVQTRIVKPSEDAASHDLQVVHTEVTFAYHVDSPHATDVLVNLNNDAEARVITPAIFEAIKAVTARYDVQDLVGKRAAVRDGIEAFVKERLEPYHIVAETTSITDFRFSQDYENAIEAKVTAQQLAEKAENDLKRIKTEAQQQIEKAKGEAEALRAQKEQITPMLLQLRQIEMLSQKWDGHYPQIMLGNNGVVPTLDILKAAGK